MLKLFQKKNETTDSKRQNGRERQDDKDPDNTRKSHQSPGGNLKGKDMTQKNTITNY